MSVVIFSHTKRQEKEYLTELLKEKGWFEHKQFPVFLPQNANNIGKEMPVEDKLFKQKIIQLQKAWKKIEINYFQIVKKFNHKKLLLEYKCHISYFGPEGKYHRPNLLFVRLRTKRDATRAFETIGHELLHLFFADFFETKKLNYPECEGTIDALILESNLSKLFPQYQKQSIGEVHHNLVKSILPQVKIH